MGDKQPEVARLGSSNSKRRIGLLIGVLATLVTAVLLSTLGRLVVLDYARLQLVQQARAQGVILHLSSVGVSWSSVSLQNAQAELEGVAGISVSIEAAQVTLARFKATGVQVTGVRVIAAGAPLGLMRSLEAWRARYATQLAFSVLPRPEVKNIQIEWRATADGPAFLQLENVEFVRDGTAAGPTSFDGSITAASARTGTYILKPLVLAVHYQPDAIEVGFGAAHLASALVLGGWQRQPGADDFHVSFRELAMGPLIASLNLPAIDAQLARAQCNGGVSLRVPQDDRSPYTGRFEFEARGWVPPHPPELDGFAFGAGTKLQSMLELDRALTQVRLAGLNLSSGELKLAGHGLVRIAALSSAHLQAELKAQLPCAALASAVAESKLGQAYGQWVARNAGRIVEGHVDVTVQIDADTRRLDRVKMAKQIGIGCGLRPLSLNNVLSLGLPPPPDADFLQHVAQNMPNFNATMPKSQTLPLMPTMKWPTLGQPR